MHTHVNIRVRSLAHMHVSFQYTCHMHAFEGENACNPYVFMPLWSMQRAFMSTQMPQESVRAYNEVTRSSVKHWLLASDWSIPPSLYHYGIRNTALVQKVEMPTGPSPPHALRAETCAHTHTHTHTHTQIQLLEYLICAHMTRDEHTWAGGVATLHDAISYFGAMLQQTMPVKYLEIGVSIGKCLFTQVRRAPRPPKAASSCLGARFVLGKATSQVKHACACRRTPLRHRKIYICAHAHR